MARLWHDGLAPEEQIRLVRHDQGVRYADADLRRERARYVQRAPLPPLVGNEHLRSRVRRSNLGTSRLCFHGRGRNTGLLRKSVRVSSGVQPIGVAELS